MYSKFNNAYSSTGKLLQNVLAAYSYKTRRLHGTLAENWSKALVGLRLQLVEKPSHIAGTESINERGRGADELSVTFIAFSMTLATSRSTFPPTSVTKIFWSWGRSRRGQHCLIITLYREAALSRFSRAMSTRLSNAAITE